MARPKKSVTKAKAPKVEVTYPTAANTDASNLNLTDWKDRITGDLRQKQAYVNLVLGLLILIVLGTLAFRFFKKPQDNLGPATTNTETQASPAPQADASPDSLPGNYTVKEGDNLFGIAQHYYNDGYLFPKIIEANNLTNPDVLVPGSILKIPKVDKPASMDPQQPGTGGAVNQTIWGERIFTETYTVVKGDWLSTIAGRAYGDVQAFDRIAKANNIVDPNNIEPGTVLKIPR